MIGRHTDNLVSKLFCLIFFIWVLLEYHFKFWLWNPCYVCNWNHYFIVTNRHEARVANWFYGCNERIGQVLEFLFYFNINLYQKYESNCKCIFDSQTLFVCCSHWYFECPNRRFFIIFNCEYYSIIILNVVT